MDLRGVLLQVALRLGLDGSECSPGCLLLLVVLVELGAWPVQAWQAAAGHGQDGGGQRLDVVLGQRERLDLGELPVGPHVRDGLAQRLEGVVQLVHALPLALVALQPPLDGAFSPAAWPPAPALGPRALPPRRPAPQRLGRLRPRARLGTVGCLLPWAGSCVLWWRPAPGGPVLGLHGSRLVVPGLGALRGGPWS